MPKTLACGLAEMLLFFASCALQAGPDISPQELLLRHRQAIGSDGVLASRWAIAGSALGRVDLLVGGSGHIEGPAILASDESRMTLLIDFGQATYSREHFITDGETIHIGFMRPGLRSPLGEFLFTYNHLLEEGLLGGVLTTHWPLLDELEKDVKVKYDGLKKVEGQKLHRLEYRLKSGRDTRIRFYFEPETFRHVRSEYDVTIAPPIGATPAASSRERRTRTKVVETFQDFADVGGLQLPRRWEIHYSSTGTRQSVVWRWTIKFNKMALNQRVDDKYFSLSAAAEKK